jgi:hypothetical protein
MGEWQVARLIPTWGISSDIEAEMRATSALLAVLSVVREFSSELLTPLGASSARKAQVESFVEVALKLSDGTVIRPDGLIRVTYGQNTFTALVEVKTGNNTLRAEQVNGYFDAAREYGYDAVLTISNEMAVGDRHPTEGLKVRANSKVQVHHYSWTRILTIAVMCKVHRGIEDPEQAWILGELIRYLESDASGAMEFSDMGPNWVTVRDGARQSTLRKNDDAVRDVVGRWDQLIRYSALRLGAEIGADVQQVFDRSQRDPKARQTHLVESICDAGTIDGTLRVPNAIGPITIEADLRARQLTVSVDVPAPTDRGGKARATWLLRQLGDSVPSALVIEAWPRHAREPLSASLIDARENRDRLDTGDGREVMRYRLVLRSEMGAGRKAGGRSPGFVDSVVDLLDRFYGQVVQGITAWVPKAPQLRRREEPVDERPLEVADTPAEAEEAMQGAAAAASSDGQDVTLTPSPDDREAAPEPGGTVGGRGPSGG